MTSRCAFSVTTLLSFLLLACQPIVRPTDVVSPLDGPATAEVPFETISLTEYGASTSAQSKETEVFLIREAEQLFLLQERVSPDDFAQLQGIDYESDSVITLFRGRRGSSNYQTVIERLVKTDDGLTVYAQLWSPSPYWESADAETYPYHLVKIDKAALSSEQVEFALKPVAITPTPPTIPGKSFLAFETIYQSTGRYFFQHEEIDLFVVTNPSALDALLEKLRPNQSGFIVEIGEINYVEEFILMAYYGSAPTNQYHITIREITLDNKVINVVIQMMGMEGDTVETTPIHVVRVDKLSLPRQEELLLRVWHEGEVLLERRFIVP